MNNPIDNEQENPYSKLNQETKESKGKEFIAYTYERNGRSP
jgi:hypothetical protein